MLELGATAASNNTVGSTLKPALKAKSKTAADWKACYDCTWTHDSGLVTTEFLDSVCDVSVSDYVLSIAGRY